MLLRSLQVQNFRSVREASLTFGRGLNVLYGPNELGKSTLSEALRAGFLLQVGSNAADEFVPWGTVLIPRVVIEFETQPEATPTDNADQPPNPAIVWRITKTFGTRGTALLERVTGNGQVVQEASNRAVESRLRELLAWGIPAPGGPGAPHGVPKSYLTTALLGEQDKVTSIFQSSLDADRTESGRTLLTEALGALAQEPVLTALLNRLDAQTREVLTEAGQRRRTTTSPLVRCAEEINRQEDSIKTLEESVRGSDEIEAKIRALSEKRNEAEEQCRRLHRQLELSKAVLASAKKLAFATEQQRAFQQAEAAYQAAEAEFVNCETADSAATQTLQSVTNQLQAAREELTRSVTKRDQLRASTATSREAKRSTLLARRDEADRSIVSANRLIEAARQVDLQRAELRQADEQLQQARSAADRTSKLLILIRLRDQQQTQQLAEAAMCDAEGAFLNREALHQEVATEFQTLDMQLQAARQQVASLSAKRDQLRASSETSREARRATLLARRDEAARDAELGRECLDAAQTVAAQRTEVIESEQHLQEARAAAERARNLVVVARLDHERLRLIALLKVQEVARQEYAAQMAKVEHTKAESQELQASLAAVQRAVQSDKDAIEQAKNKAREDQFRKESLQAGRLRAQDAVDRARNDVTLARAASENRRRLTDAESQLTELTSQRLATEAGLSNKATELDLLAAGVHRLKAITFAVFFGCAATLTLAVVVSDLRAVFGTLAALTGIAGGLLFFKLANSQRTLGGSTAEREHMKEQRSELATKCLMAQSTFDAAQRDWNHTSQQISATFESVQAAVDQAPERFRAAQDEFKKIEEQLGNLESLSEQSSGVTSQQLESGIQCARDLEERLKTSRHVLDEARLELFAAEARVNAADEAVRPTSVNNDDLDQLITTARRGAGLKPYQPAPTLAEADEFDQQARANMSAAESRIQLASERLADREARHAELSQACDQPAEQILAAAECSLNDIAAELETLDSTLMSEVDAADRECQQAEASASQLSEQRDLAKSAADSATQSLSDARASRNDRRWRFETARSTAAVVDSTDPEYFTQIRSSLAKPSSERFPDMYLVDLAAMEREIDALYAVGEHPPNSAPPTLVEAETQERQARETLADAESCVRLETERLTDRDAQHTELVAHFDQPAEQILASAEQTRIAVEAELKMLDTNAIAEVDAADHECQQAQAFEKPLSEQQTQAKAAVETTSLAVAVARQSRDEQRIRFERLRPSETSLDVGEAESLLADARHELEQEFAVLNVSEPHFSELEIQLSQWSKTFQAQTQALDETRGQLGLVGGAVAREQLEQEREVLDRLRSSADELELEFQAAQYLLDLLKQADAKHAAHLGRSLAKPVSEQFLKLTGDRYGDVLLAPNLSLQKVVANNSERDLETLSVGARHQLATLIRLSLAAYLQTTLVLDDQLAYSDPHRLLWFRDQLRASVAKNAHQIVVVTCRPLDYLEPGELPPSSSPVTVMNGSLTVVDLGLVVSHH